MKMPMQEHGMNRSGEAVIAVMDTSDLHSCLHKDAWKDLEDVHRTQSKNGSGEEHMAGRPSCLNIEAV